MRILCIGCSWTENYPSYITGCSVNKEAYHGRGLWYISDILSCKTDINRYDRIILQLPTPIRFKVDLSNTCTVIAEFKRECMNDEILIHDYKEKILELLDTYRQLKVLYYNTGGYPIRHPYDFGERVYLNFKDFIKRINAIQVELKGHEYTKDCNDMHPSEIANKICAKIVTENI